MITDQNNIVDIVDNHGTTYDYYTRLRNVLIKYDNKFIVCNVSYYPRTTCYEFTSSETGDRVCYYFARDINKLTVLAYLGN